jgi:hypothetical protein
VQIKIERDSGGKVVVDKDEVVVVDGDRVLVVEDVGD